MSLSGLDYYGGVNACASHSSIPKWSALVQTGLSTSGPYANVGGSYEFKPGIGVSCTTGGIEFYKEKNITLFDKDIKTSYFDGTHW